MDLKTVYIKTMFQPADTGYLAELVEENDETIKLVNVIEIHSIVEQIEGQEQPTLSFRMIPFTPRTILLPMLQLKKSLVIVKEEGYEDLYHQLKQSLIPDFPKSNDSNDSSDSKIITLDKDEPPTIH